MPRASSPRSSARFPDIVGPKKDDICYATQNRQDAVKFMAPQVRVVIVVGIAEQLQLQPPARGRRALRAFRRTSSTRAGDLDPEWIAGKQRVGVTAGASAPEVLVARSDRAAAALGAHSVRTLDGVSESVVFPLPKGLGASATARRPTPVDERGGARAQSRAIGRTPTRGHHMRHALTRLAWTALLVWSTAAVAQTVDVEGVKFEPTTQVGGQSLQLNGTGVRTRAVFKVYAAGLYVPQKSTDARALVAQKGPRRIAMGLLRDVSADSFADALNDGLKANNSEAELSALQSQVDALTPPSRPSAR